MLASERDADDGDAKQYPEKQMRQANPETTDEYPDYIHNDTQTATRIAVVDYPATERP